MNAVSRLELVSRLRRLGFEGPFPVGSILHATRALETSDSKPAQGRYWLGPVEGDSETETKSTNHSRCPRGRRGRLLIRLTGTIIRRRCVGSARSEVLHADAYGETTFFLDFSPAQNPCGGEDSASLFRHTLLTCCSQFRREFGLQYRAKGPRPVPSLVREGGEVG